MSDNQSTSLQDRIEHPRGGPRLWGQSIFDTLDSLMRRVDRAVEALIPAGHNPFSRTGAIAVVSFLVSAVTGILLLIWYRPSVHQAYESVMAMESVWIGEFIRSLHRYSSDVCIFFALIHAIRLFFAGRFTGARSMAWVTGVGLVVLLWAIGWTGYLLVWDEPAQLIAQGTAVFLDVLPIFAEPISRSFLADELVPPLLFFVIFFIHMLVPLVMVAGLWIHVARVQRPKFMTPRPMTLWTIGTLVVMAAVFPAGAEAPASLQASPEGLNIDIWYLAPLWLTDRLGAGMLWAVVGIVGGLVVAAPWIFGRSKPTKTATVDTKKCNGCTLCARDCPYDAIVMVPRTDDRNYELEARLDPKRCVGCGICAGSCNPGGIGLDWLPVQAMRKRFDDWIDEFIDSHDGDEGPVIAFVCSDSAGHRLDVDDETGVCPQLPGYRVVNVPCSGWVQPLTVERALRRGAAGILVVGCSGSEPQFREGVQWTEQRLSATRRPKLRRDKLEAHRVRQITFDRTRPDQFVVQAAEFRQHIRGDDAGEPIASGPDDGHSRSKGRIAAGATVVAAAIAAVVAAGSAVPYPGPPDEEPKLVVSVNHYGQLQEECEPISEEEQANQPVHMKKEEDCTRRRSEVGVEVTVDGQVVYDQHHRPRGVGRSGAVTTLDTLTVEPGEREVRVRIDDGGQEWSFDNSWRLDFEPGQRQVVLFDTEEQFRRFGL